MANQTDALKILAAVHAQETIHFLPKSFPTDAQRVYVNHPIIAVHVRLYKFPTGLTSLLINDMRMPSKSTTLAQLGDHLHRKIWFQSAANDTVSCAEDDVYIIFMDQPTQPTSQEHLEFCMGRLREQSQILTATITEQKKESVVLECLVCTLQEKVKQHVQANTDIQSALHCLQQLRCGKDVLYVAAYYQDHLERHLQKTQVTTSKVVLPIEYAPTAPWMVDEDQSGTLPTITNQSALDQYKEDSPEMETYLADHLQTYAMEISKKTTMDVVFTRVHAH